MSSILTSIKKLLGISEEYTHFDADLIMQINSIFAVLNQLGVGIEGYSMQDSTAVWSDFLGSDFDFEAVKTYVYLRVKLLFDPPLTSAVMDSTNRMISELEWRLSVHSDGEEEGSGE